MVIITEMTQCYHSTETKRRIVGVEIKLYALQDSALDIGGTSVSLPHLNSTDTLGGVRDDKDNKTGNVRIT